MSTYARPGGVVSPVVSNRFSSVFSRIALTVAVFGVPLAMACARVFEVPSSLLGWSRICVSLVAVGIIAIARRRDFAQRVVLAFLLESASGIAAFAYVDVPYLTSHTLSIADAMTTAYANLTHRDLGDDLSALPFGR